MAELPLLVNLTVGLAYALAGGLLARRVGLPTIVGYLVAGAALGPFTPGFRGDEQSISQMAEIGVILLMFGVGLHFSLRDLWQVRQIAIPGALLQLAIVSAAGAYVALHWGFSAGGAWVFGIAISVASTVVMLRSLMDRGWLDTPHGKVAVGWLVFEDLLTVAILVLMPVAARDTGGNPWIPAALALGKALVFVGLMIVGGQRLVPALLTRVVGTRSRELFVLVSLTVAVGTALASAKVFGVSIALGAFVAGMVVSESPFSHQLSADLLPFREAFAVLFFVSIGMLVNPTYVVEHWGQVVIATLLIVVFKGLVSGALGAILPGPGRTALVLAAGRSQIGEFSFILGQSGVELGLLTQDQYSLVLAGAILSITLNALVFKLVDPIERQLKRSPLLWRAVNHGDLHITPEADQIHDHVVIVGCGRVGRHIAEALHRLNIPRLVVEADPARLAKLRELGVPVLYGDASNSEILDQAGLARARAVVITLPDDAAALAVAATVRRAAPALRIIARASTWDGAVRLRQAGVDDVVRPELEGGVEIVRRTLLELELPVREVQHYAEIIRREELAEAERPSAAQARVLEHLLVAARDLEVIWMDILPGAPVVGQTIATSGLRTKTGASIVGISRGDEDVLVNPGPDVELRAGDRAAVIGRPDQIQRVEDLLHVADATARRPGAPAVS
jgi:CPA2 family monovalent cation:H+ antiporter-2